MTLSPLCYAVTAALMAAPVLAEEAVVFDEVVVTANKAEQSLSKTAGSVAVVTGETLEREGATELYDALKNEPGVAVTGGVGMAQNFVIRGMTGNRIAVVQDGIPSSDGFGANDLNDFAGRNAFDLGEIKQMEVVKGASSSVHGSGAIGGVVVLTSKAPEDYLQGEDLYVDASALYSGISDKVRGASTLAFRQGDFDSLVRVSGWTGEETHNYDENLYSRDNEGYSGAYTLYHYLNDSWLLKGKASFYRDDVERNEGRPRRQRDGQFQPRDFFERRRVETALAYLGFEHEQETGWYQSLDLKGYWRLSTQEAYSNVLMSRDRDGINEQRREVDDRSFEDEVFGLNVDLNNQLFFSGIQHDVAYGAEFKNTRHERPVTNTVFDWSGTKTRQPKPFVPANSYSAGVYFRDEISWDQWRLTPGVRFDMHRISPDGDRTIGDESAGVYTVADSDSSEFSPSLSLAYQWTPNWNTYLSYNHGYRAASYNRVYGYANHDFIPLAAFVLTPNLDLKAESSEAFELGSKYASDSWKLYMALFYNDYKDFIDQAIVGYSKEKGLFIRQYVNRDDVETYGFEVTLSQQITPEWSWIAKAGVVSGKDGNDEYIRPLTPWEGNLELNYAQGPLRGYARLDWAAAMNKTPTCVSRVGSVQPCTGSSGWAALDMGASYRFDFGLNLSVNLKNALDRKYIRYQDIAGQYADETEYFSIAGRHITVNAKMKF